MLVLSRKHGEQIAIITPQGDVITVKVSEIDTGVGAVKLGIQAPREFQILRTEIIGRERLGG